MAKFKVVGADKDTGVDIIETITADTAKEAGIIATSRGMVITSIERLESSEGNFSAPAINIVNQNANQNVNETPEVPDVEFVHPGGFLYGFLSFLIPGLGQLCKGQIANGIVWFFAVYIGYALFVVPGLILHVCCILGAAMPDGE